MYYVLFFVHLAIAFLLCVVVLLQRSKGGGLAGAFGGVGAGEAMFGARGVTTFLHKATIWLAVAFMLSSMGLAILTARRGSPGESNVSDILQDTLPTSSVPGATPVPGSGDDVVPQGQLPDAPVPQQDTPSQTTEEESGGDQ